MSDKLTELNDENGFLKVPDYTDSVDSYALIKELQDVFTKHLILPDGGALVLALWVIHTYAIEYWRYTPRLFIYSPVPGCGKSVLLGLLRLLCYRSSATGNTTPSSVFRTIDKYRPVTILIDEIECFAQGNEQMRSLIDTGYDRLMAYIDRTEANKKNFEPKKFYCFSAMALAGLEKLHSSVMSRSILIMMKKKKGTEYIEPFNINEMTEKAVVMQGKMLRWISDNANSLQSCNPVFTNTMENRTKDIWKPLFAIAQTISEGCLAELHRAARVILDDQSDDVVDDSTLLKDIKSIFDDTNEERLSTMDLLNRLYQINEHGWGVKEYGQHVLNPHTLARRLLKFCIKPVQWRDGDCRYRGYIRENLEDAFERYIPISSCDNVTCE